MSARPKFTLLSLTLALFFTLLAATITSQSASATSAQSPKTASGHFSVSGQTPLAFSACKSGQALGKSGDATTTRVCAFSYGKEADQLSRLNYYGYRYYDPLSLQWTQADPLYRVVPDIAYDSPRLMSLYTFSLNNPVRYLDPDGREPNNCFGQSCRVVLKESYRRDDAIKARQRIRRVGQPIAEAASRLNPYTNGARVAAFSGELIGEGLASLYLQVFEGGDTVNPGMEISVDSDGKIQISGAPPPPPSRGKPISRGVNGAKKHNPGQSAPQHKKKFQQRAKDKRTAGQQGRPGN